MTEIVGFHASRPASLGRKRWAMMVSGHEVASGIVWPLPDGRIYAVCRATVRRDDTLYIKIEECPLLHEGRLL